MDAEGDPVMDLLALRADAGSRATVAAFWRSLASSVALLLSPWNPVERHGAVYLRRLGVRAELSRGSRLP